jgi:outer membrane protein assembly factor BamB
VGVRTEAVIELDLGAPAPVDSRMPPVHRYRRFGLALSVLLLLSLAGAVPALAPLWRRDGTVPVVGADSLFAIAGDRLYVSVASRGERTVTAWQLRPFRTLWSAAIPAGDADRLELRPVPGRLLVRVTRSERGPSTTALDDRSGAVAWTVPQDVQPLPGGHTGLVQEQVFNDADRYDEESGAPGPLWFADTGTAYGRPPTRSILHGLDLTDGRERWSQQWLGSIFAAPGPAVPASAVVVSAERSGAPVASSHRLELLDADTGAVHRRKVVETAADSQLETGAINAQVTDGLLVLERTDDVGSVRTAFGLVDLAEKWRLPYGDVPGTSRFCAGVPCVETPYGLSILDPATGAVRWKAPASTDLTGRGGHAVAADLTGTAPVPLRTVDVATGAPRVDLTAWPTSVAGAADAPLVLAAPDDQGGTAFGLLRPGDRAIRALGRSESSVSDCSADAHLVACRTGVGIEIFEYRS